MAVGRFLGEAANGTPAKPAPAETARYLSILCVRNRIVSCVSALLAITMIGSWRFDRLALGFRLHQFSKVGIAYCQQGLHYLLKTARSATRYRRSISPVAAPDLAVAIRCWYEHDEERISRLIDGVCGLHLRV